MSTVAVATYNMSFASDQGLNPDYMPSKEKPDGGNFASEAAFLKSNNTGNPRQFWLNAFELVKKFWNEVPNAGVMGFQELNKTPEGSGTGSDALAKFADTKGLAFAVDEIVVSPTVRPALGLMWKKEVFGEYNSNRHSIVDFDYVPTEVAGLGKQPGRPMFMIETSKGFVLISIHAPNQASLSAATQKDLKDNIKSNLETFAPGISADKVFIMGDFNDRYDALTSIPITGGELTYTGKAPLSCCHNWDSSCTNPKENSRYKKLDDELKREKVGTCDPQGRKLAGPGPREVLGDEGNIENYRYYGDKVFGANPVSNITMYPPGRTGASKESDHEMVMAEYKVSTNQGGGRHRGKKHGRKTHKAKRHHKKRGTRRH